MAKESVLKKVLASEVRTFKILNRKGFAAVCRDNLTEGASAAEALERMNKALKRIGYTL
jgi:hypothetical protein